ncbi:MAG TPA: gamma carbonic anhydrase family protein [Candidatus Alectryocaccobium stercorigallinarum]|nr:gamma carbonic anhydrase family protein [Candidatus Alectryocaccobium stercorigallinarum]
MIRHIKKIDGVHIADNAVVCGDVTIGKDSSVWYGAVIRGDDDKITIGERTNIQDNCVLHCDEGFPITVGDDVTVGHGAVLHGCTVGDGSLIGMGAVVLNGAKIGKNCLVGAGALVTGKMDAPDGSMIIGSPAKVKRELTEEEVAENMHSAVFYVECAKEHFE